MSEQTTQTTQAGTVGGLQGDLAEAFNPAAGPGCCGSPAANTGTGAARKDQGRDAGKDAGKDEAKAGPCCGTAAEAKAEGACCGTTAKTEAVAAGQSCCG